MTTNLAEEIKQCVDAICNDLRKQAIVDHLNNLDRISRLIDELKCELQELDYKEKHSEYAEELYKEQHPHVVRDESDL